MARRFGESAISLSLSRRPIPSWSSPVQWRGLDHRQSQSEQILPTASRSGPYRLFFYMADRGEPPHVHVERDHHVAKFWLAPVALAHSGTFKPIELRRIKRIVRENRHALLERWDENFGV